MVLLASLSSEDRNRADPGKGESARDIKRPRRGTKSGHGYGFGVSALERLAELRQAGEIGSRRVHAQRDLPRNAVGFRTDR